MHSDIKLIFLHDPMQNLSDLRDGWDYSTPMIIGHINVHFINVAFLLVTNSFIIMLQASPQMLLVIQQERQTP